MNDNGYLVALPVDLRDYFAAKAMQTIIRLPTKEMRDEWLLKVAEIAYEVADAMIAERSKK